MKTILRLAWRETRATPGRYAFFLLSVAIGVAALVAVKSFAASMHDALFREARQLLAADLQIALNRPATADQMAALEAVIRGAGGAVGRVTETVSMAAAATGPAAAPVEVKAVEPGRYPFYGVLEVQPAGAALAPEAALVGADLLPRLGIEVGDRIKLGTATFTVAGVVRKEPDRIAAGFGLGPRVLLTQEGLARANLIAEGSRARYAYLVQLPPTAHPGQIRQSLVGTFEERQVRGIREAQPQIRRFLDRMTAFLALVSLVALVAGGLGVAQTTRAFLRQKLDTIAILKCLGFSSRQIILVYLIQALGLGLAGSALGAALGALTQFALPALIGPLLSLDINLLVDLPAVFQGLIAGTLTAGLFALLPLLAVAQVPPALVFRREMAEENGAGRRLRQDEALAALGIIGVLGALAAWQSRSLLWGLYFAGGLVGASAVLGLVAWLSLWGLRRVPAPRRMSWRYGLANLFRPGNQAIAVALALGLGVTAVAGVFLLENGLLGQVRRSAPVGSPNLVVIGVPKEQVDDLRTFFAGHPAVRQVAEVTPVTLARLLTVDDRGPDGLAEGDQGFFNRQWSLTWSATMPPGDTLVAGRWWDTRRPPPEPTVSVEEDAARRLGIVLGSRLTFEIEGQPVTARVQSLRRVDWGRFSTNFLLVFAPGTLEPFGATYAVLAHTDRSLQPPLLRELVDRYPAVTALDIGDILETAQSVLDRIALVVEFVAGFAIAAGLIIMAGGVAATRFQRVREAAILRTLGATRRTVAETMTVEYAALGLLGGAVGVVLAHVLAGILTVALFELPPVVDWPLLLATPLAAAALTVVTGNLAAWDVLNQKPLAVLRGE